MAKNNGTQESYRDLQSKRRELEAELRGIDGKLRAAILSGDVAALDALSKRKAELPGQFIAASLQETNARREMFAAEDADNTKQLVIAEAEHVTLQTALIKRQREVEIELAEMKAEMEKAEQRVSAAQARASAARELAAAGDAGFKRSLEKVGI